MAEQVQEISTEGKVISEAAIVEIMNQCKIEIQNNSSNKVNKVEGKGLSTNDFTDEDKEKLNNLSNYDDTSLSDRVATVESTLSDKVDKVEGKNLSTNDFSNEEKSKLAGLSNYDDTALNERVTNIENIIPSTVSEENKLATIADIPTGEGNGSSNTFNTSDFDITEQGEVSLKPSQRAWIGTRAEWDALSTEEKEKYGGVINITDDPNELDNKVDKIEGKGLSTNDYTDEEKIKLASLSNYDDTLLSGRITTIENTLDNKVNRAEGKGLSTEDYTTEEKNKLAGLTNYDDTSLSNRVTNIEDLIPSTANEDNKLATLADVPSDDPVDYNNVLTLITEDSGIVQVGETYTLGSGAKTNQNSPIQVKCLSVGNETAIMQTYGVTASTWPGSGDLTESYSSYFGELSNAISGVKLPTGNNVDSIEPSKSYEILMAAADNYSLFGANYRHAWLGTPYNSDYAYVVGSTGSVGSELLTTPRVCAPYFTLNLSKVLVNNGVIELNSSYKEDAEFTDVINKIERKLNNRYTKSEVDTALNNKVDKVEGKSLSTNDYTDAEKTKLAGLSNYDDTEIDSRVQGLENIIPESVSSENRLATMEDISGGSEVSVEQKVSEGVNIASITIDGHTTELFAPEGGSGSSTITIVNPNLYDASTATKGSGNDYNIYCEISVSPNTDYVFDIQNSPYGWAGVRVGNTTIGNNAADRTLVEFNSGSNTSVRTQFFPGNSTTVAQTDFSNILFYEAGKIPGETTTIENPNSGSGSSLISTDITEILLTASSQHPIEIVLIGDSITEGYSATGMSSAGSSHPVPTWANYPSWAGKLNSYITANFPNVTVTNRGYSGQVSSYGASNINSWITNNRQIAIVMFGTNNRTTQANMNSLANDYTTMLNRCKSVGAKMVPMCCIPTTPYNQSISGKYVGTMEQVHNILVNWAKTNGYELLDLYSLMMAYINNNTSNLETMGLIYVGSADNNLHIHPSDAGHAVMFDFIKHKLGIGTVGSSGGGSAKYRHRVAMYCLNGGTTYVVVNLYNNRSTPYNAATTTTTDEINAFKADVLAAGYTSALQKGTLMCSGVIKGTHVYGMYMGTSSSGLNAVADKLNFIDGTNFNVNLPLETGGTNSASSSLRLWDTVEPA